MSATAYWKVDGADKLASFGARAPIELHIAFRGRLRRWRLTFLFQGGLAVARRALLLRTNRSRRVHTERVLQG
jgi:hypothetical protein